jgi:hypothetical protein
MMKTILLSISFFRLLRIIFKSASPIYLLYFLSFSFPTLYYLTLISISVFPTGPQAY